MTLSEAPRYYCGRSECGAGKAHYLSGNDAKKIKHFVTRAHLKKRKIPKNKR
nr:MAG TPA: hypothetical protein [Caudoviricetes sp.]